MDGVSIRQDTASADEIVSHLSECSADFVPPLASRVDLPTYAAKLRAAATTYEAWHGPDLVGLIAVYRNATTRAAFITSVSTSTRYRRSGLARSLLTEALQQLDVTGYGPTELEVDSQSDAAVGLYRSLDFTEAEVTGSTVRMTRGSHLASE